MCTPSSSRVVVLAVAALALGCPRQKEDAASYAARNAVIRYNQALVEAFRASRADLLTDASTEDEMSRVAAVIAGLTTRSQFMLARQTSFEVARIVVYAEDGGVPRARVEAKESWSYEHRSLTARETPVTPKTITYELTYELVSRPGGGWLVTEVRERAPPGPAP